MTESVSAVIDRTHHPHKWQTFCSILKYHAAPSAQLVSGRPWVRFQVGTRDYSLLQNIQNSSATLPASTPMAISDSFPEHNVAKV